MPVYDFKCADEECRVTQEHFIPFGLETPDPIHCNESMIKMFSIPAVHLKGTGWGSKP